MHQRSGPGPGSRLAGSTSSRSRRRWGGDELVEVVVRGCSQRGGQTARARRQRCGRAAAEKVARSPSGPTCQATDDGSAARGDAFSLSLSLVGFTSCSIRGTVEDMRGGSVGILLGVVLVYFSPKCPSLVSVYHQALIYSPTRRDLWPVCEIYTTVHVRVSEHCWRLRHGGAGTAWRGRLASVRAPVGHSSAALAQWVQRT